MDGSTERNGSAVYALWASFASDALLYGCFQPEDGYSPYVGKPGIQDRKFDYSRVDLCFGDEYNSLKRILGRIIKIRQDRIS